MVLRETADELIPELAGLQRRLLIAGAAGAVISAIGWFVDSTQFFQSYLMAYLFVLGLTLGSLALGMVHQLSGGAWGVVIRRPIGAAARVLPVLTVLFIPIALGMHQLYEWTHDDVVARDPLLQHKHLYLNTPFFLIRAAAPIGRRSTTPQAPPDNWCTIPSARQPSVAPRHNMYAIRYDWKNCVGLKKAPTSDTRRPAPPARNSVR